MSAHLVVVQRDIEVPVGAIRYALMSADHVGQRADPGCNAANVEASLVTCFAVDRTLASITPNMLRSAYYSGAARQSS